MSTPRAGCDTRGPVWCRTSLTRDPVQMVVASAVPSRSSSTRSRRASWRFRPTRMGPSDDLGGRRSVVANSERRDHRQQLPRRSARECQERTTSVGPPARMLFVTGRRAHVLAGAGVVVQDDLGRVLLLQRSDDRHWGIPGGAVQVGETWAEAATRECFEETGWTVQVRGLLGIYSEPSTQTHRYPGGATVQFFGVVFLAVPISHDDISDGEACEIAWFRLDNLPKPVLAADVPVLEDAARAVSGPFLR